MENNDEYRSRDIGESSAILASGVKLLRLEKDEGFFWFIFENKSTNSIIDKYWSGELKVKAKTYNDCYKNLKDRIFARQGGQNG